MTIKSDISSFVVLLLGFAFISISMKTFSFCLIGVKMEQNRTELTEICSVCGAPGSSHQHYGKLKQLKAFLLKTSFSGAIVCYSCRAFFRRGIQRKYRCSFNTNSCELNAFSRVTCKKCRFDRCLAAGKFDV